MTAHMHAIQPKPGEILDVLEQPANWKIVTQDGRAQKVKFIFDSGAVLYVPLPRPQPDTDDEVSVSAGPMRS
jgi:hypothetical protein